VPDYYDRRVEALVRLEDGRDLGKALIAAGLAKPWNGKRVEWCAVPG
jgi:endonuclease YncB( thermonuclease family)